MRDKWKYQYKDERKEYDLKIKENPERTMF